MRSRIRVLIVTNMYPTDARPAFGTFVKEQVESLHEAGLIVDVYAFSGESGAASYLAAVRQLRHRLCQADPSPYDLIHAHYSLSGLVARLQSRYPVVVTFHGSDLLGGVDARYRYTWKGRALILISNLVALLVTRSIVVADVQRRNLWLSSAITLPMGVDLELFRPMSRREARERIGMHHDKRLVLFAAHPGNRTKRFDVAEAAVQLLHEGNLSAELLPVYDVPHERMPFYMNACDALALTSMHEGSPCVVKEALACNVPIVSVNVGDVAERIRGVPGCHLCERMPEDVAAKLREALQGGRLTNGRASVEPLSTRNIAQELIKVYEDVVR